MRLSKLSNHSKLFVFGLALFGALVFSVGVSQQAGALSTEYYPNNGAGCDVSPCSTDTQLLTFETKAGDKGGRSNLSAYFTSPTGQLKIINPNYCPAQSGNPDRIEGGNYYDDPANFATLASGTIVSKYVITYPGKTITMYGRYYSASQPECNDDPVVDLPGLTFDNQTRMYLAQISATVVNVKAGPCQYGVDVSACDGLVNYFRLQATGGNAYAIAQHDDDDTSGNQVTIDSVDAPDSYADYSIRFGSDCSVTSPKSVKLTYYDMDNDPAGGAQPGPGPRVTMELRDADTNALIDSWQPPDDQNKVGSRTFTAQPNQKFRWLIKDVRASNTIQFGTPFNGIFALIDCTTTPPPPPAQPFFSVTGGDTVAGASFATSNGATTVPCESAPHVNSAGISSWNKEDAAYAGAGGEYAALALGQIQDFASGQGTPQSGPGGVATGLTFSNVSVSGSVNPSGGKFGGLFGSAPCVDYWSDDVKPDLSTLPAFTGNTLGGQDGVYKYTGDLTLNGGNIPTGKHVTIYVEGDVAITKDITYTSAAWSSRQQIPSFKLIVHGSIFIGSGVTQLNGLYAAIPDPGVTTKLNKYGSPNKGTISTCSTGFNSYNLSADGETSPIDGICGQPLTINGSVAAQQLWLLRASSGTVSGIPASPIETINYTPETWLSIDPSTAVTPDLSYQSIIGLPPVL
jgi:hypothetical protein